MSSKRTSIVRTALSSISEIWHPTQIVVIRLALLVLFVSALIPKFGSLVFDNARVSNSIIVFIAFLGFEVLLAASNRAQSPGDKSKIVQTRELTEELEKAFDAKEVELDVICYSAETIFGLLVPIFFEIRKKPVEKIKVRILIRDLTKPFVVPCDSNGVEDAEYREIIVRRNAKIVDEFYSNVNRVRRESPELDFSFEVRMQPFEPLQKGIIVNRKRAFWCLYPVISAERVLGGKKKPMWDYEGHSANLMELSPDGSPLSAELFQSVVHWFDTVWVSFSNPLAEGDMLG